MINLRPIDFATIAEYQKAYRKEWYKINKEKIRNQRASYYKEWYEANKEHKLNWCKQYREENKDRIRERVKVYEVKNRKKRQMRTNARNRGIRGTLFFRYRKEIEAIYAEARRITEETGILHVVDHIWPLKHPTCCGLHVPWNLQVITGTENDKKGNKLPLDGFVSPPHVFLSQHTHERR